MNERIHEVGRVQVLMRSDALNRTVDAIAAATNSHEAIEPFLRAVSEAARAGAEQNRHFRLLISVDEWPHTWVPR